MIGMLLNVVHCQVHKNIPSNLSTTAALGTEESGCCRDATVVERFKRGDMGVYGIAVLSIFSSSILVILILMCGIVVSSSPAVCGFSSF